MVREPSKSITPPQTTAEKAGLEAARSPASSTSGKKARRPLSAADAAAAKELESEAWKPHRATFCWQADLRDFGIEEPLPPAPPAKNKKQ